MRFSEPIQRVVEGLLMFFGVCVIAVVGYMMLVDDVRLLDAIYMVIITIFAVGYGEVFPIDTPALQALTMLVIVAGYVAVIYVIGGLMRILIDGELNKALGARKMTKDIERLENHTIVCGFGRMGSMLARELALAERPFVIIDCDERRLQSAEELGYLVLNGDATEEHMLAQAHIERASVLAAVLSEDAMNVFVTITAREMNAELMIIARGENPRTEKKLLGCGANKVVLPTAIGASKIAQLVIRPSAESMLEHLTQQSHMHEELGQIGLRFDELMVEADSPLVDKALSEIEVRSNHGFLVVGIRHLNGATDINPASDSLLEAGDTLIVLGHSDDIPQLAARFSSTRTRITYRGATSEA